MFYGIQKWKDLWAIVLQLPCSRRETISISEDLWDLVLWNVSRTINFKIILTLSTPKNITWRTKLIMIYKWKT